MGIQQLGSIEREDINVKIMPSKQGTCTTLIKQNSGICSMHPKRFYTIDPFKPEFTIVIFIHYNIVGVDTVDTAYTLNENTYIT